MILALYRRICRRLHEEVAPGATPSQNCRSERYRARASAVITSSDHEWAKFINALRSSDHDHQIARLYGSFNEWSATTSAPSFDRQRRLVRYSNLEFKAGDINDYNRLREELTKLK